MGVSASYWLESSWLLEVSAWREVRRRVGCEDGLGRGTQGEQPNEQRVPPANKTHVAVHNPLEIRMQERREKREQRSRAPTHTCLSADGTSHRATATVRGAARSMDHALVCGEER